ncbi:AI-2E family transporter [Ilumatobacter sp.]|uniref:AI-2E family transporter n=1 Tax=Ilumatobacter sp. TaxID=1967498 RepID=UPI003C442ACD
MPVRQVAERTGVLQPRARTAVLVAAGVLGVILVRNVFVAAHQVFGWAVAASLLALFIAPVVRGLDAVLPRPVAGVLSFVLLVLAIVGVAFVFSTGVHDEVERLNDQGPAIAEAIEQRGDRIGTFASDIGLADQVAEVTERLADNVGSTGDSLRNAAFSAPTYLITMILTIFLLIYGQRLLRGGLDLLPHQQRDALDAAVPEATRRAQIYVGASLVQGVVNGVAVYIGAVLIDAPAAGLLALFAATVGMLPYLGIVLGWLPLIVFSFGLVPLYAVAAVVAVALGLQSLEGFVWRPRIDERSLHLGPAVPIVAAVLGYALYGVGGALCASATVVVALALVDQLTDTEGQALPTPLDDIA